MSLPEKLNPPNSIFTYERVELADPTTGRLRFHNVTLTRSMYPYRKGIKFDLVEIDFATQKFTAQRGSKRLTHNFIFQLSQNTNAKPTN